MNIKYQGIEIIFHDDDLLSMKLPYDEVNVKCQELDFLFEYIQKKSNMTFFLGRNLNFYLSNNEESNIIALSQEDVIKSHDFDPIFINVKEANILISRALVSQVWSYYEQTAIIFLRDIEYKNQLMAAIEQRFHFERIRKLIPGIYFLYKLFEPNVLWLEKSSDSEFPLDFS